MNEPKKETVTLDDIFYLMDKARERILKRRMHQGVTDKRLFYELRSTPDVLHPNNPDKEDLRLLKALKEKALTLIKET